MTRKEYIKTLGRWMEEMENFKNQTHTEHVVMYMAGRIDTARELKTMLERDEAEKAPWEE